METIVTENTSKEALRGLFCLKKWAQITESIFLDEAILLQPLLIRYRCVLRGECVLAVRYQSKSKLYVSTSIPFSMQYS